MIGSLSPNFRLAAKNELDALSSLANPVIMIDEGGGITFFNPAAEDWFGYKKAAVIGSKINMLMPDLLRQEAQPHASRVRFQA